MKRMSIMLLLTIFIFAFGGCSEKEQVENVSIHHDEEVMTEGEHMLFTVTVSYNEDGTILNATKAMNTNITITH